MASKPWVFQLRSLYRIWGSFPVIGGLTSGKWFFLILKRFHSAGYTWQWGRIEYCPHHALLFGHVGRCDMILSRRIKQGGSIAGIDRACWWSMWVSIALLSVAKLTIVIGSGEEVQWWRLKMQVREMAGDANAFYSWRDAKSSRWYAKCFGTLCRFAGLWAFSDLISS